MDNFTNSSPPKNLTSGIQIFGYPGPLFYAIHIVALSSCSISTICSSAILIFLFVSERRAANRRFYKWTKGERLVVYIAAYDFAFSTTHTIDHAYILAAISHPVDFVCRIFAFLVLHGFMGQWMVIFCSAVSAFIQVVFEKPINMGRYDWKLLTFANVIPGTMCTLGIIFEYLGPSGAWCVFESNELGSIMNNVSAVIMLVVFFTSLICYISIFIKVKIGVSSMMSEQQKEMRERSNRSGRIMMVFVFAFMVQWWPWAVQALWGYFAVPNAWFIVVVVFFCNIGGVINAFAYTIIRRKYMGHTANQAGKRSHANSESFTAVTANSEVPEGK